MRHIIHPVYKAIRNLDPQNWGNPTESAKYTMYYEINHDQITRKVVDRESDEFSEVLAMFDLADILHLAACGAPDEVIGEAFTQALKGAINDVADKITLQDLED